MTHQPPPLLRDRPLRAADPWAPTGIAVLLALASWHVLPATPPMVLTLRVVDHLVVQGLVQGRTT